MPHAGAEADVLKAEDRSTSQGDYQQASDELESSVSYKTQSRIVRSVTSRNWRCCSRAGRRARRRQCFKTVCNGPCHAFFPLRKPAQRRAAEAQVDLDKTIIRAASTDGSSSSR